MPHRPDTWTEALFIYLFSIPCQFLDFIHVMVSIFFFNGVTVKTENRSPYIFKKGTDNCQNSDGCYIITGRISSQAAIFLTSHLYPR